MPTLVMRDVVGDRISPEFFYRTLYNQIVLIGLKVESSWDDLEAELENQAKSQFLAHISHELRTLLTAILGLGDLLRRSIHLPEIVD